MQIKKLILNKNQRWCNFPPVSSITKNLFTSYIFCSISDLRASVFKRFIPCNFKPVKHTQRYLTGSDTYKNSQNLIPCFNGTINLAGLPRKIYFSIRNVRISETLRREIKFTTSSRVPRDLAAYDSRWKLATFVETRWEKGVDLG